MTLFHSSIDRDANYRNVDTDEAFRVKKTVTFTGAAGAGAQGTFNVFNVTGAVVFKILGICEVDLVGASATASVGISGNTTLYIASTTATNIDAGLSWTDNTPGTGEAANTASLTPRILPNSNNIIGTIATADVTAGRISFYGFWRPISDDGNVVPA